MVLDFVETDQNEYGCPKGESDDTATGPDVAGTHHQEEPVTEAGVVIKDAESFERSDTAIVLSSFGIFIGCDELFVNTGRSEMDARTKSAVKSKKCTLEITSRINRMLRLIGDAINRSLICYLRALLSFFHSDHRGTATTILVRLFSSSSIVVNVLCLLHGRYQGLFFCQNAHVRRVYMLMEDIVRSRGYLNSNSVAL